MPVIKFLIRFQRFFVPPPPPNKILDATLTPSFSLDCEFDNSVEKYVCDSRLRLSVDYYKQLTTSP